MPIHIGTIGNSKEKGLHLNFQIARGEPFYAVLDLDEEENDFSAWTIDMVIRQRGSDVDLFSFDLLGDNLDFDTETGILTFSLTEEQTLEFMEGLVYDYDIRVRVPNSNSSIIFWGRVSAETWLSST